MKRHVCQRRLDPLYIVSYYSYWDKTSVTCNVMLIKRTLHGADVSSNFSLLQVFEIIGFSLFYRSLKDTAVFSCNLLYPYPDQGAYIKWYIRNRCAGKEQFLLFDLFKAFDYILGFTTGIYFISEKNYYPSCVRNMLLVTI